MDQRRMCPNCRAFITENDRVCPYCGVKVAPRAIEARYPSDVLSGIIPGGKLVTGLLLLVNVALYLGGEMAGPLMKMLGSKVLYRILGGEWWRLITAGYLHAGLMHIGFNMLALYQLGPISEEIYGARRLFVIYTGASVMGFTASCFWAPMTSSLGASAGLFGLLGALIAYGIHSKSHLARSLQRQCLINAGLGLLMGIFWPFIDNAAHLGGLAGGFLIAYAAGTPRLVDDVREKFWGAASLATLLLTLYAFYEVGIRMLAIKS